MNYGVIAVKACPSERHVLVGHCECEPRGVAESVFWVLRGDFEQILEVWGCPVVRSHRGLEVLSFVCSNIV